MRLRALGVLSLFLVLPILATGRPAPRGVVLVVVDTLRADALGGDRGLTPFLDGMARGGLVGTQHTASSSWTRPALASLLTGLDPGQHGLLEVDARLPPGLPTLAERLHDAGFRTGAFLANPVAATPDLTRGFDLVRAPAPGAPPPRAEALVLEAADWILAQPDAPYFALVLPMDPHAPYDPPPEERLRYCPGCPLDLAPSPRREYPEGPPDPGRVQVWRNLYDGEVRAVDAALELLAERLRGRSTRWVITADHGEAFGEHGVYEHAFHLWEEVLHVPLVVSGPGVKAAEIGVPTAHTDVFSLVLALAGLRSGPTLLDGPPPEGRVIRSQVGMYGIHRLALRQGSRKLVVHRPLDEAAFARFYAAPGPYPSVVRERPRVERYDLAEDPGEARSSASVAGFEVLEWEAASWLDEAPRVGESDPWLDAALQALGYRD